jgi:hypothetical protein
MGMPAGISFESAGDDGELEDVMTKQQSADLAEQAWQAFERDLPQLWEERPGQWVAYQGERQLGFAAQQHELYHRCFEQGFARDEFIVFCIEPILTEVDFGVDAAEWGPDGSEAG